MNFLFVKIFKYEWHDTVQMYKWNCFLKFSFQSIYSCRLTYAIADEKFRTGLG